MKIAEVWRVDYIIYRNPDFSGTAYADSRRQAEEMADKLRKLKHVSEVRITPPRESRAG